MEKRLITKNLIFITYSGDKMVQDEISENAKKEYPIHYFTSPRRTISETDVVNFVNLVGLHEPFFIDMEFIKEQMDETHHRRFVPAPLTISIGIGLVAPFIWGILQDVLKDEKTGPVGGMTGLNARIFQAVYPEDTIKVDLEISVREKTKKGHTLVNIRHIVKNQREEVVVDFLETALFMPPKE